MNTKDLRPIKGRGMYKRKYIETLEADINAHRVAIQILDDKSDQHLWPDSDVPEMCADMFREIVSRLEQRIVKLEAKLEKVAG